MADIPVLGKTRMSAGEFSALPETTQPMQLIEGEVIVRPAPKDDHQKVVTDAVPILKALTPNGALRVVPADLYLDEANVLQPDVFWVSSANTRGTLIEGYWHGAPDLIVEVLRSRPFSGRAGQASAFHAAGEAGQLKCSSAVKAVARTEMTEAYGRAPHDSRMTSAVGRTIEAGGMPGRVV